MNAHEENCDGIIFVKIKFLRDFFERDLKSSNNSQSHLNGLKKKLAQEPEEKQFK